MQKNLVSLITPCHNSAKFVHRLLDSVLQQTYPYIEMILVDNASEDNTVEVLESYIPKFESRGYTLKIIKQGNLGPTGIQSGLSILNGEFFSCPDSDDYYNKNYAIERFVEQFRKLPDEFAYVRSQIDVINEENGLLERTYFKDVDEYGPKTLFEDLIYETGNITYVTISYMIKTEIFRKYTNMKIWCYPLAGPNRQLMCPVIYKNPYFTIKESLVCYLVRKNSVSHGGEWKYNVLKTLMYDKAYEYIHAVLMSCPGMPDVERKKYENAFTNSHLYKCISLAFRYNNREDFNMFYKKYSVSNLPSIKQKLKYIIINNFLLRRLYFIIRKNIL